MPFTYRFTLRSSDTSVTFTTKNVPNWDNIKFSLEENTTYRGVFFEYSNVFEFSGDIRTFIRNIAEKEGIDAYLRLKIEQGNESGHDSSFVELDNELVAEFNETYELTETTAKLAFVETGFKQKVINREDVNTNLDILQSVDGDTIEPFAKELYQTQMHDRVVKLINSCEFNTIDFADFKYYTHSGTNYLPVISTILIKSDDDFQNTFMTNNINDIERMIILESESYKNYLFQFNFENIPFTTGSISKLEGYSIFLRYAIYDENRDIQRIKLIKNLGSFDKYTYSYVTNSFYNYKTIEEYFSIEIPVNKGESVALFITIENELATESHNGYYQWGVSIFNLQDFPILNPNKPKLDISTDSYFDATTIETLPIYEAVTRNLQIITGQQVPFKSSIFGKTQNGYSEDGELAYMTIANGKMIRGFPYESSPLNINFKDFLKDLINQFNLVGYFSNEGTDTYFNLERFEDVYDLNESTDIDIIGDASLIFADSMHFSNIKNGCKNFSYEEVNGLESFNGEFEWQTPIKSISKTLDIKLKELRTDDYGLEFTRRKQYITTATEDYRSDEDIFLIDCKKINDNIIRAAKAEDFTTVTGIFSPDTAYNLRLSTGRQLKEWYSYLAASLNYKSGNFIKFVKGSKNPNLESQLITEDELLVERNDIDINNLGRPLIIPQLIKFKGILDFNKYKLIKNNPHKTVKFNLTNKGENIATYGFIKKLDYDLNKGEAQMELIRANR